MTTPHISLATPSLADLAAAQAARNIFAFDMGCDERQLVRLQDVYARKRAQFEAFYHLFEDTNPDFVLRGPDGRELVLRVPASEVSEVYSALRDWQDQVLLKLEREIVALRLRMEEEAALEARRPRQEPNYAPHILALCQPAAPQLVAGPAPTTAPTSYARQAA